MYCLGDLVGEIVYADGEAMFSGDDGSVVFKSLALCERVLEALGQKALEHRMLILELEDECVERERALAYLRPGMQALAA